MDLRGKGEGMNGGQRKGQEEKKVWSARISNESNILRAMCRRKLSHEYENS